MVAAGTIPTQMTTAEFFTWNPPDGQRWQLVDGEPQAMAPANRTHGAIQAELGSLIRNHLTERRSPCSVVVAPGVVPYVQSDTNVRVPDLGVTCSGYQSEESALSDPALLAEILSPSNKAETWTNVWAYTTMPSVQEILVIRSATIGVDLLQRNADGSWPARPQSIEQGEIALESIDFRVAVDALYRTTRLARA